MAVEKLPADVASLPDDDHKASIQTALQNARIGPTVYTRRGFNRPSAPWSPPTHIVAVHPEHGEIKVNVATETIEKR